MVYIGAIVILLVMGSFAVMFVRNKPAPEKSAALTAWGIACTFIVGLFFTMLIPSFNNNWSINTSEKPAEYHNVYEMSAVTSQENPTPLSATADLQPGVEYSGYTAQQLRGRLVYQREGCMYCHTQQIRPLINEEKRYSIGDSVAIPADQREYIWDQPHFLGTRRIGPDLSREGGKYSDDWHYSHFYYPRQMVPGSIMPAFTWLFTTDAAGNPIPKPDVRDLVSYVQTLGFGRKIYDPSVYGAQGGWGPWLRPRDQQYSQQVGVSQVLRARQPVLGGGQKTPANAINTPAVQSKP